jgi:uncharacterized protein
MKQCIGLLILTGLVACQTVAPTPPLATPHAIIESMTPLPTAAIVSTESATPYPFLMYPYTIDGLRGHQFQGGDISILSTLETEMQYTRYLISYQSDGLMITGIMQVPVGDGPFPVIVMNHGYFNREDFESGSGSDRAAEFIVNHGYITLASDYRSWGGSDVGPSLFHTGLVIDVINLMNAIPSIPQADAERIGIWGHSMGGGITTKILTIDSRVKAAVLYAPNSADDSDLIARWGYGCIGDIPAGEVLDTCNSGDVVPLSLPPAVVQAYKDAANDPAMMQLIAPIHHLNLITAPIQIHIGTADGDTIGSTPPEWSYKLAQALLDAHKDVELFTYDGERHSFIGQPWYDFMERVVQFFDKYVKNQ